MDKIKEGERLLYTQKTGNAVFVPLADEVIKALEGMKFMPFWSGVGLDHDARAVDDVAH